MLREELIANQVTPVTDGNNSDTNYLKQLFITVSPVLCESIKDNYEQLIEGANGGASDGKKVQLKHRVGDIKDYHSFTSVPVACFPAVTTFKTVLRLLNGVVRKPFSVPGAVGIDYEQCAREVDFDCFRSIYYSHMSEEVRRNFDVDTVYQEIMSSIKGSLGSLQSSKGFLSRDSYLAMVNSKINNLTLEQRNILYDAFENYENKKMYRVSNSEFPHYDTADIVSYLYQQLKQEQRRLQEAKDETTPLVMKYHVDSVYIDEVQDLTSAQIALLGLLCINEKGFVMAGDTAQTVRATLFIHIHCS